MRPLGEILDRAVERKFEKAGHIRVTTKSLRALTPEQMKRKGKSKTCKSTGPTH